MTPDQVDAEANEIWLGERRQKLVANLLARRPPAFAEPGELNPKLKAWARMLAEGIGQNLILTGPVGAGKTWAAWKAAEEAVRSGYEGSVIITTAAALRRSIAPATADPREFARCFTAGLLVIDDLGTFRLSEWDLDNFSDLIDSRWAAQIPTAVTSNKTNLGELLGPRISSRLQHSALKVALDGADRRRQQ